MSNAKHPGVVDLPANASHPRRARWVDPETGRRRIHHLPKDDDEARRWCIKKSAELMLRKARTDPPPGGTLSLPLAVEKYLAERHRLEPSTLKQYRYTLQRFQKFVGNRPLSLPMLRSWRTALDRPGTSAQSVNRDLAHVSAFLNHARLAGDIHLAKETIGDGLKRLPQDFEKKEPLTVAEMRDLVRRLDRAVAGRIPSSVVPGQNTLNRYRALVITTLLTGMRAAEALHLSAREVQLDFERIQLGRRTKTKKGRFIDLKISPAAVALLQDFEGWGLSSSQVRYLRAKLHPELTFQRLRVTCGTYLACAPGIYGGASAAMAAMRLGHSIQVAQDHYVGQVLVDPSARTLEAALGIDDLLAASATR